MCLLLFVSNWLISALSVTVSCHLLLLGVFACFCSRAFRCDAKLLVWGLPNFFMKALSAMNFPLNTAFIVSYRFGNDVSSFSLNSIKALISFFISFLTNLFSFHDYEGFLLFLLLSKSSFSPW